MMTIGPVDETAIVMRRMIGPGVEEMRQMIGLADASESKMMFVGIRVVARESVPAGMMIGADRETGMTTVSVAVTGIETTRTSPKVMGANTTTKRGKSWTGSRRQRVGRSR